ncbi:MAG: DUF2079 domain-containing protein [Chloroflexi bacterium]|nr:DUF2079 domain-containing protein [Chloroflexota bacterium]
MNVFGDLVFVFFAACVSAGLAYWLLARQQRRIRLSIVSTDRAFLVLAIAYTIVFSALAIVRYLSFHTGYLGVNTSWDLGQYGQLIWNSLNGRLLEGTFVRDTETFLGKSFTPILLAFVPLYAVWSSPIVLLIVQVVGLGAGGFPIYWFARQRLGGTLALVIALAYYLYPGLEYIGLTEFHEIALAVPFLAYATFFLLREHYKGFFVCLGLALLVKEEIALIAIIFGVYIFLFQRKRWLGLGLAAFGAVWAVVLLQFLIPFFRGAQYGGTFYYFGQGSIGGGGTRYGYLGRSVPEILTTLITRPDFVLEHILVPEKIAYVLHLLVPLMLLPLIGMDVFLLTLPTFGYSLLSTYGLQYEIRSYYFSPLLPFIFFATIVGAQRVIKQSKGQSMAIKGSFAVALTVASVGSYFLQSPGPLARNFQPDRYVIDSHALLGNQLMAQIPNDAVVIAQNEFLAQLSNRRQVYEIPVIPDYRQADYILADAKAQWYRVHQGYWETQRSLGYFETLVDQDGYWLGRRRSPYYPREIQFGDSITFLGHTLPTTGTIQGGMTLRPIVSWRSDQSLDERYGVTVRVVDLQGHVWSEEDREPDDGEMPTSEWQVGKSIGDQYTLKLPVTIPSGEYRFAVALHPINDDNYLAVRDEHGQALGTQFVFGTFHVEKNKQSFSASDLLIERPLFVDMREMRFLGSTPIPQSVNTGDSLSVGLYWRARSKPQADYNVVVQLRNSVGQIAVEQVVRPANGTYPTLQWDSGEVLLDWHDLTLPSHLSPGDYQLLASLRDAVSGQTVGETPISTITIKQ